MCSTHIVSMSHAQGYQQDFHWQAVGLWQLTAYSCLGASPLIGMCINVTEH